MDISKKLEFESKVYQKVINQLSIIDQFKGSWKVIEFKHSKRLKQLRKIATIESIGSSTRIEGATLSNKEVEKLLKSVSVQKLSTRDQQEVIGYYEALHTILDNYHDIPITERYVHQLHSILLKHSVKDQFHKGKYKSVSNQVVANYPDGSKRTIFKTTEPGLTQKEMENLFLWLNNRFKKSDIHPVLITATFVYEFLSIHPYQDGNGRLSRLLTTLILMKQGYKFTQYVSFEHIIEERKEEYYKSLIEGQKNRYTNLEKIDSWVLFFLECLTTLTQRLKIKYDTYNKLERELNDRQKEVLNFIEGERITTIGKINRVFENYSRNTLKKDLFYLVNESLIIKTGELKGTKYHFKN